MIDLKEFRKQNNFTQNDAATYFGCKQAFISQIERNKSVIPKDFISKIKGDNKLLWKPIFDSDSEKEIILKENDTKNQNADNQTNINKLIESNQLLIKSIEKVVETNSVLVSKIMELTK